jgi:hypothetical protein
MQRSLLIHGATQIVQVVANGEHYLRGNSEAIKNLTVLNKSSQTDNLCVVSIEYEINLIFQTKKTVFRTSIFQNSKAELFNLLARVRMKNIPKSIKTLNSILKSMQPIALYYQVLLSKSNIFFNENQQKQHKNQPKRLD